MTESPYCIQKSMLSFSPVIKGGPRLLPGVIRPLVLSEACATPATTMYPFQPEDEDDCREDVSAPAMMKVMTSNSYRWTVNDESILRDAVKEHGTNSWELVASAKFEKKRTPDDCKIRYHDVIEKNVKRGPWTKEEDDLVRSMVMEVISKEPSKLKWSTIAKALKTGRMGKQARERWYNHLDPNLKGSTPWSEEEDRLLFDSQSKMGNRWCEIAKIIVGRSENDVKNRWNSYKRKEKKRAALEGSNGNLTFPTMLGMSFSDSLTTDSATTSAAPSPAKASDGAFNIAPVNTVLGGGMGEQLGSASSSTTKDGGKKRSNNKRKLSTVNDEEIFEFEPKAKSRKMSSAFETTSWSRRGTRSKKVFNDATTTDAGDLRRLSGGSSSSTGTSSCTETLMEFSAQIPMDMIPHGSLLAASNSPMDHITSIGLTPPNFNRQSNPFSGDGFNEYNDLLLYGGAPNDFSHLENIFDYPLSTTPIGGFPTSALVGGELGDIGEWDIDAMENLKF